MDANENDDGRPKGNWETSYSGAFGQIGIECTYLVALALICLLTLWSLLSCAVALHEGRSASGILCAAGVCDPADPTLLIVSLFFISGVLGGTAFAIKWLYHTIARQTWHRDRFLWRLCVPLNGGILAIFVSFIFAKTFGVTFAKDNLGMSTITQLAGFSFLVGVFADGVLAMLERLARNIFGTLESLSGK